MSEKDIQAYWNSRATEDHGPSATTNDVLIRELETKTVIRTIEQLGVGESVSILDIGCGDGRTLLALAHKFPKARLDGVDFSSAMIESAVRNRAASDLTKKVRFNVADVCNLATHFPEQKFEIVITDRCLINLTEVGDQKMALEQIASAVETGGYYLAIENFVEGQENMNKARQAVGLPNIPIRWHNKYLVYDEFVNLASSSFDVVRSDNFASAYYYATRVIYSKLCQMRGEQPNYLHEIHRIAIDLAAHGDFSPVKLVILRRKKS